MSGYLARRAGFAIVLVFAVSSGSFLLTRLAPGDFAVESAGFQAGPEAIARERARLGLDRPIGEQYLKWIASAARLDFGRSMLYGRPVTEVIPDRAANTAILALTALLLATAVGLPLGIVTGTRRGGVVPIVIRGVSLVLLSTPPLLTSLFLVFAAAKSGWLPAGGMQAAASSSGASAVDLVQHLVVPALAIALPLAAVLERLQSQAMADVINAPFVLAAAARGVPRSRIVWRSALKPALRPVAGVYGLVIGSVLSGSFVVEVITAWPGLGSLTLQALRARDVYLAAGCAAAGAVFLAAGTLAADVALAVVDPRGAQHVEAEG